VRQLPNRLQPRRKSSAGIKTSSQELKISMQSQISVKSQISVQSQISVKSQISQKQSQVTNYKLFFLKGIARWQIFTAAEDDLTTVHKGKSEG
jgi:hypothetical protein